MEIDYEQRRKDLKELQAEPLYMKVQLTIAKILEFYNNTNGNCYLSCSGGADSLVLKHIVDKLDMVNIETVFVDTGLEYPSVREKALLVADSVIKPAKSFYQVLTDIGYPLISKEVSECVVQARKCLDTISAGAERERTSYLYRLQRFTREGSYSKDTKTTGNIDKKEFP